MTRDNNQLGKFELSGIAPAPRGVPKIDVTYEIDANGILNVSAVDTSSGKSSKITITNDKGRLTKEDIDRMVAEADRFKAQDEQQRERVAAKNSLEAYAFQLKSTADDSEASSKLSNTDKETIRSKVGEVLQWLDSNSLADKDELEHKQKELEATCAPIIRRMYEQTGSATAAPGASKYASGAQASQANPTIEEVD
eukprot:m.269900 g.269900  ORF g.269900 m.269900 type:complete len:196 (-) comp54750_c1_seq12:296-883(-)